MKKAGHWPTFFNTSGCVASARNRSQKTLRAFLAISRTLAPPIRRE
jgi:hypothetical protein